MTAFTIACFVVLFVLCVAGLFSSRFEDNWLQHFGLIGMGLASASGIHRVMYMVWVPPEMALFVLSAALFGCGTAYKVWHHRHAYERKHADKSMPSKVG